MLVGVSVPSAQRRDVQPSSSLAGANWAVTEFGSNTSSAVSEALSVAWDFFCEGGEGLLLTENKDLLKFWKHWQGWGGVDSYLSQNSQYFMVWDTRWSVGEDRSWPWDLTVLLGRRSAVHSLPLLPPRVPASDPLNVLTSVRRSISL